MKLFWLGHSCFLLKNSEGLSVLTDPFDEGVGYRLPEVMADIVTISHDHHDHNNLRAIKGKPFVVRGSGRHAGRGLEFRGVESYHDQEKGKLRGANTIFCFSMDGIKICHLGDLGHKLSDSEIESIGPVDLLFIPVGGIYTIDAQVADIVMKQLRPQIAVPMHYQTKVLRFKLDPVENFLKGRDFQGPMKSLQLTKEELQKGGKVFLFSYSEDIEADR